MRPVFAALFLICLAVPLSAQDSPQGPTDKKAQKSYQQALEYLQKHEEDTALWFFRDADKKDQGRCLPCQEQMVRIGLAHKNWKAVEDGATGLAAEVQEPKQQAVAHYYLGMALMNEGIDQHQNDWISRAHSEFSKAISLYPGFPDVVFDDGKALAQLHNDEEAKAQFEKFIAMTPSGNFKRWRAQQFIAKPDLARANLVPEFAVLTSDGQRVTTRDLAGKVALVYFWGTTCDVCRRAFPHLREIEKKFQNPHFLLLSVSVDYDATVWRSFLQKNEVPGLQYMEGFNGPLARAFGVGVHFEGSAQHPIGPGGPVAGMWITSSGMKQEIPKTFTVDADGVLEEEKMSDSLDDRLQGLLARAEPR